MKTGIALGQDIRLWMWRFRTFSLLWSMFFTLYVKPVCYVPEHSFHHRGMIHAQAALFVSSSVDHGPNWEYTQRDETDKAQPANDRMMQW
jgi:hypothetical protein